MDLLAYVLFGWPGVLVVLVVLGLCSLLGAWDHARASRPRPRVYTPAEWAQYYAARQRALAGASVWATLRYPAIDRWMAQTETHP